MPLTHSCLQHSPAPVMDSHHLHRQSWKRAPGQVKHIPASGGAILSCTPGVAQQEHTALRCLVSPTMTHCPAVTPELCFLQAQSQASPERCAGITDRGELCQQAQTSHVTGKPLQQQVSATATADPTCDSWDAAGKYGHRGHCDKALPCCCHSSVPGSK